MKGKKTDFYQKARKKYNQVKEVELPHTQHHHHRCRRGDSLITLNIFFYSTAAPKKLLLNIIKL
jgi:hypothetical protein